MRRVIKQWTLALLAAAGIITTSISAWALFSERVSLGTYTAKIAASYGMRITQDGDEIEEDSAWVTWGKRSKFVLSATGTVSTGYCSILLDGEEYITEQIPPGEQLTFYVKVRGQENEADQWYDDPAEKASDNNADREDGLDDESCRVEIIFTPHMGNSLLTESAELSDAEELENLVKDGDTLYCGEEEASQSVGVTASKTVSVEATAAGNGTPETSVPETAETTEESTAEAIEESQPSADEQSGETSQQPETNESAEESEAESQEAEESGAESQEPEESETESQEPEESETENQELKESEIEDQTLKENETEGLALEDTGNAENGQESDACEPKAESEGPQESGAESEAS